MTREQMKLKAARRVLVTNFILVFVFTLVILSFSAYQAMQSVTQSETFAQDVVINKISVGGKSFEQGRTMVLQQDPYNDFDLMVSYNGQTRVFDKTELGVSTNVNEIIKEAYQVNKTGELLQDYNHSMHASKYESEMTINPQVMLRNVSAFLEQNDIPSTDAAAVFDETMHSFSYTESKDGTAADAGAVCKEITKNIENADFGKVAVTGRTTEPKLSTDDLRQNTVLIGEYETIASNNEARDINIRLMCNAINGLEIKPGQTLSINELVGERTAEKGFQAAPAIADGKKLVNELGGGICQVAGTLYNAALLADMEIVERVHHSWPSNYLPIGQDATLNWDDKDLMIKNTSSYSMYIASEFYDQIVHVEIYGQPQDDGIQIIIKNKILEEIPVPKPEIISTNDLMAGQRVAKITGRKGYVVEVYREYVKDGKVIESERISKDTFHEIKGVILEGTNAQQK
ncbi:MAG: VanW family protein [Christensenellaceae bacterium]